MVAVISPTEGLFGYCDVMRERKGYLGVSCCMNRVKLAHYGVGMLVVKPPK